MSERDRTVGRYLVAGVGVLLLLAELPFAFAAGLLAPLWAVLLIIAMWCLLFALALRWFRRHSLRVIALPLVGAALWFGVLTLGEQLLGWNG